MAANAVQEILNHDPLGLQKLNDNFGSLSEAVSAIASGINFRGTFDPTTGLDANGNTIPAASEANRGWEWAASVTGAYTPPGNTTAITFAINDRLVSNGVNYDMLTETNADATARDMAQQALTALDNKVSIYNSLPAGVDLNAITTPGLYGCTTKAVNLPDDTIANFTLLVEAINSASNMNGKIQTLTHYSNGITWKRVRIDTTNWSPWRKMAAAEPTAWYDLPVDPIYTGKIKCTKDQLNRVFVNIDIKYTDDRPFTNFNGTDWATLGYLPVGYRCDLVARFPCCLVRSYSGIATGSADILTGPDGQLHAHISGTSDDAAYFVAAIGFPAV